VEFGFPAVNAACLHVHGWPALMIDDYREARSVRTHLTATIERPAITTNGEPQ
jgi:hypothetical protein